MITKPETVRWQIEVPDQPPFIIVTHADTTLILRGLVLLGAAGMRDFDNEPWLADRFAELEVLGIPLIRREGAVYLAASVLRARQ